VIVEVDEDGVGVAVVADQDPQVDIWGAERRTDLFEKAFGMPVRVSWSGRKGTEAACDPGHGREKPGRDKSRKNRRHRAGEPGDAG
jgi:hypothetical protein